MAAPTYRERHRLTQLYAQKLIGARLEIHGTLGRSDPRLAIHAAGVFGQLT